MINLAIDIGTYSIKFLHFDPQKDKPIFLKSHEEIIDYSQITEERKLWDIQFEIIETYLDSLESEYQFYINTPSDLMTTRFINIPIKSKKKALQMLPFQIEEDLPHSLSECHYDQILDSVENETRAIVGIVKTDEFWPYYNKFNNRQKSPNLMTSHLCSYAYLVEQKSIEYPQAFAIIDIGHHSSKAYFFLNKKLVANNFSYLAGSAITNIISKKYKISKEEAQIYKHQNAFFLQESQLEKVNEKQKKFASIMKETFSPLITDIKRWCLGFRVHHGFQIEQIYITGGTANTKNITSFLSSELKIPVRHLECLEHEQIAQLDHDPKLLHKYISSSGLALASKKKSRFFNFLKGPFALQHNMHSLPIENLSLLTARFAIICFIASAYFIGNSFFIKSDLKKINSKVAVNLKSPDLNINGRERRQFNERPMVIFNKLERKEKEITQEVKSIQSSLAINALRPLQQMLSYLQGRKAEIIQLTSSYGMDFNITLKSEDIKELEEIEKQLKKNDIKVITRIDLNKKILSINGEQI